MRLNRQPGTIAAVTLSGGKVRLKVRAAALQHSGLYLEVKRLLPEVEGARIAQNPVEGWEGVVIDVPGARLGEARHAATLLWGEDDTALWAGPVDLGRKAWVRFHADKDPVLLLTLEIDGAPMAEVSVAQVVEWGGAEVLLSLDEAQQALPLEEAPPKAATRNERTLPLALSEVAEATEAAGGIEGDFADDFDGGYAPVSASGAAEYQSGAPAVVLEPPAMPDLEAEDIAALSDAARSAWVGLHAGAEVASTNTRLRAESVLRTLGGVELDTIGLCPEDEPDLVVFWGPSPRGRDAGPAPAEDYGWRVLGRGVVDGVKVWRVVPVVFVPTPPGEHGLERLRAKLRALHADLGVDGRTGLDAYLAGLDPGQLVVILRGLTGDAPTATSPTLLRSMIRRETAGE